MYICGYGCIYLYWYIYIYIICILPIANKPKDWQSISLVIRKCKLNFNETQIHTYQNGLKKTTKNNNKFLQGCSANEVLMHCCWKFK